MGLSMKEMEDNAKESETVNNYYEFLRGMAEIAISNDTPSIGKTLNGVADKFKELYDKAKECDRLQKEVIELYKIFKPKFDKQEIAKA